MHKYAFICMHVNCHYAVQHNSLVNSASRHLVAEKPITPSHKISGTVTVACIKQERWRGRGGWVLSAGWRKGGRGVRVCAMSCA